MISDELRELLSAYVDGELPHGEAARVEESAKRDPRLRRHGPHRSGEDDRPTAPVHGPPRRC